MIQSEQLNALFTYCHTRKWEYIWLAADGFILVTGLWANLALLWLFLKDRKPLSASQVLGVNIIAMDLLYLAIMPPGLIYQYEWTKQKNITSPDLSSGDWEGTSGTDSMLLARDFFNIFNLIGCPLLLSCMCMERYLAVMKPVLYLKMRKREYRMAVSAVVWLITLSYCVGAVQARNFSLMILPVSITVSCLFILMLACLSAVIWSLQKPSPAKTTFGHQACSDSPLKRQAVCNVLLVVVPAVISYLPVLVMFPLVTFITYQNRDLQHDMCYVFEFAELFPKFGVLIGPLFYLSKAINSYCFCCRQATCQK